MSQTIKSPFSDLAFVAPGQAWRPGPLIRSRWFVTGRWRQGKSTLGASIPGALVIDVESKLNLAKGPLATYAQPTSLEAFDKLIHWLCTTKPRPFDFVVIDTVDELFDALIIPGMTAKLPETWRKKNPGCDITEYKRSEKGSGGWRMATNRLLSYPRRLKLAGYGWMMIGHQKETETGTIRPAINPGAFGGLYRQSEYAAKTECQRRPGTKLINIGGGKTREVPDPSRESVTCLLHVASKVGDDDVLLGSNVALPSPIQMPYMEGWTAITAAYDAIVGPKGD